MPAPLPEAARSDDAVPSIFDSLASVIYAANSFDEVYSAIVHGAVELVDGCDHATIMQRGRDGRYTTAVSTDEVARLIDKLEQQHHQGPCLDAIIDSAPHFEDDLTNLATTKWPELASDVIRLTPVRSVAGFRILAGDQKIGALNLFSDAVHGIDRQSADQAIVLASFASVAVGALHQREQARTLATGLESNREIGKAIGLLMAFHKISDAEAFNLLRKTSQDMNIKLAEVARQIVAHHNEGHPPHPSRRSTGSSKERG
jgi:GAF domain-containing protein